MKTELAATAAERAAEGNVTYRVRHVVEGTLRHFEARARWEYDAEGRARGAHGVVIDVTERREADAHIAHLAHHDALTGLPNRVLFRERLDEALARRGWGCAVCLIDLDRFKEVNDTLGHPVGDALLRAVAARLQELLRETDTLARLGGDEFAVIQSDVDQPQDATGLARRVVEALGTPFELEGHQVVIGTSIGISLAPADGIDADALLKGAGMALYWAKEDGRGCWRFFEPEMDARMQRRHLAGLPPHRGESVSRAIRASRAGRRRRRGVAVLWPRSGAAGAGNHRDGDAAGHAGDAGHAAAAEGPGRAHRHGRFRHRLFQPELPAALSLRQGQDRPQLHPRAGGVTPEQCHRPRRDRAVHRARHDHHRRGGGDQGTVPGAVPRGLRRGAGLPVQPAVPGRRDPGAAGPAGVRPIIRLKRQSRQ
ncbi:protein of unknown function [Rhodovastum atsumiense]|nr:protein of unknown function [Rhodovastum atsumiense]